jgi:DNA modification methylase
MISVHRTNAWHFIESVPDKAFDHIIADPMYDQHVFMNELRRICSGNIILFCDPMNRFFQPDEIAFWVKQPSTKNTSKRLSCFVEEILIQRPLNDQTYNPGLDWANYVGVYHDIILEKRIHPYQKPLSLLERLIRIYTRPGELIFDPFFGSGSTLIAADRHGRRAVGCELNPDYFETFVNTHPEVEEATRYEIRVV